jgi:hypothetical protein
VKEEVTEGEGMKGLERTSGLSVREPGVWGKHRTEVTEATEGEGMEGCRGRVRLRPNRDVEWWSGGVVEWWSGGSFLVIVIVLLVLPLVVVLGPRLQIERGC